MGLGKGSRTNGSVRPWPLPVFGVNGPDSSWFGPRLRPFSYHAFHTPFPGSFGPHLVKTSYLSCRETSSPFIREMADKATRNNWPLMIINSGYCPMVTCPFELCQAIIMQTASGQDFRSFFSRVTGLEMISHEHTRHASQHVSLAF